MTRAHHWMEKASALLYVVFSFELGVFLLVFPWLELWEKSWFSSFDFSPFGLAWERIWDSAWFRGAISGLGLINVVISFVEVFRLRRFSAPVTEMPAPAGDQKELP